MTEIFIGIVTALTAVVAIWFAFVSWKAKELRKDEILAWSVDCIDVMQRTQMVISDMADNPRPSGYDETLQELKIRSSVQVERGRLFFQNVPDEFGSDKPPAYRGLRPVILDCLVANFQICKFAPNCPPSEMTNLKYVSLDYTRKFVSYAQEEVGRSRKSKSGAEAAGNPIEIESEVSFYGDEMPKTY